MIPSPVVATLETSWRPVLAPAVVTLTALVVMLAGSQLGEEDSEGLGWIALSGLVIAALCGLSAAGRHAPAFAEALIVDNYTAFFYCLIAVSAAMVALLSLDYVPALELPSTEYYTLLLLGTVGMMLMAAAGDLIVIFLGLEMMSISVYVMAAIARRDPRSSEAGLKYFLLGAFSTGFLLYGIALLYGATGSIKLEAISRALHNPLLAQSPLVLLGLALMLIGFGFKVAAVPFHAWTPDAYEGAPTPVTALMAVGIKSAAFAGFLRLLLVYLTALRTDWTWALWVLAALTMSVGNLAALLQDRVKRMLAYSAIAHAGYILVGMTAAGGAAGAAVLYYLLGYVFANLGAFAVLVAVERVEQPDTTLADLSGLARGQPMLAAAMALFMLSLTGLPPLAGFVGKFYVFSAALQAGYVWLVVLAALNSAVATYYYVRVIVAMYVNEDIGHKRRARKPGLLTALAVAVVATIIIGLYPRPYVDMAAGAYASAAGIERPSVRAALLTH
jgi:NADH-quinone oxidoreductase subunit N